MIPLFCATVLLLLCGARPSAAVTWNVKKYVNANLTAVYGHPADLGPECKAPGVCTPYTIKNLPNGTVWYWCGWRTHRRTQYWVNSTGAPVSVVMLRESEMFGCALNNPSTFKYCGQVDNTLCDTLNNCYTRVIGQAFPDDACLLIANNDKKLNATNVTVTMIQYFDRPRYYGTVFTILITIVFCVCLLTFMTISCRQQYCGPTHRLEELQTLLRLDTRTDNSDGQLHCDDSLDEDDLKNMPGCTGKFRHQLDAIKISMKQGVQSVAIKLSARNKDSGAGANDDRRQD